MYRILKRPGTCGRAARQTAGRADGQAAADAAWGQLLPSRRPRRAVRACAPCAASCAACRAHKVARGTWVSGGGGEQPVPLAAAHPVLECAVCAVQRACRVSTGGSAFGMRPGYEAAAAVAPRAARPAWGERAPTDAAAERRPDAKSHGYALGALLAVHHGRCGRPAAAIDRDDLGLAAEDRASPEKPGFVS